MRVPFLSASLSRSFGRSFSRAAAASGLFVCLAFGCSKQGQGERCDQNNGNLDCDGDLVCKGEAQLSLTGNTRGVGLCCPAVTDENSVDACRATRALPPEPDAGPTEGPQPVTPEPDAGTQADAATPAP
jgi:hypothetical protein